MQVFRYYFKLARSMWGVILTFTGIFMLITGVVATQLPSTSSFVAQKPEIAIFDRDQSTFSRGLVDYLAANTSIITVDDTDMARKDAIYFQRVSVVYTIPAQFGDNFFARRAPTIATLGANSQGAAQANALVSNYLRLAEPRVAAGMTEAQAVAGITADVTHHVSVVTDSSGNLNAIGKTMYFMNTLTYVFIALSISIISAIMVLFAGDIIRRRNLVSGTTMRRMTLQILLGNFVFVAAMWGVFMLFATILYPSAMLSTHGLLYAISAGLFALVCLSIAFLIGTFIKSRRAISAINNVVALGMSFLCGVFVPLKYLGDTVNFSKLLPAYWYISANEKIATLADISWQTLRPIFADWLIVFGFAAGIFFVTMLVSRIRQRRLA